MAQPNLGQAAKLDLRNRLSTALLASDRVDEGIALLRKDMNDPSAKTGDRKQSALKYAQLGMLLKRPAVFEEGVTLAKKLDAEPVEKANRFDFMRPRGWQRFGRPFAGGGPPSGGGAG